MVFNKNDRRLATLILTKDQLAAVGSVAVESTFCEEFVELFIWALLGVRERQGKFLTAPLQMNSRLDLLSSLMKVRLRSATKRLAFTDLISRLREANSERNVIVHGSWEPDGVSAHRVWKDGAEKHPAAIAKKHRLNSPPVTMSATLIEKSALKIAALTWELMGVARAWETETKRQALRRKYASKSAPRSRTRAHAPPAR